MELVLLVELVLTLLEFQQFLYLHLNLIVELGNRNRNNEVLYLLHLRSFHYRIQDNEVLFESVVMVGIELARVAEGTQAVVARTVVEQAPTVVAAVLVVGAFLIYLPTNYYSYFSSL
jgi:hypothetical protein